MELSNAVYKLEGFCWRVLILQTIFIHGATGYEEIEPGCYIVGEVIKHFFDDISLKHLFQAGWDIHSLEETTI
ncbi:MAG: hypothetical protein JXA33_12080 [Anaerolineae bacterium]|nr:hypothetical protein [Anaerolineae bacterium]